MQVIFYISLSFTGVSEKIKSKILVTCKILDFIFFRVRPKLTPLNKNPSDLLSVCGQDSAR